MLNPKELWENLSKCLVSKCPFLQQLYARQAGAMVIFSMGNKDLAKFLVVECGQQGVLTLAFLALIQIRNATKYR